MLQKLDQSSPIGRYVLTGLFVVLLAITIIFNGLAGTGNDPFNFTPKELSDNFHICITPAGYTFAIWGVIYFFLFVIAIYAGLLLVRNVNNAPAYKLGGAVSLEYLSLIVINLCLNIGWLFAWDDHKLIWSSVLLFLIEITNVLALIIAAIRFRQSATKLYVQSKLDFYMNVIVLNGHLVYETWTTIAALLNLGSAIAYYDHSMFMIPTFDDMNTICITLLSVLLVGFIVYFVLEQTVLKKFGNTLLTHYIVYLWALVGAYVENKDFAGTATHNLLITNIAFGSFMIPARIVFLVIFNRNNQIYASTTA